MQQQEPRVSVIIPTHGRSDYLEQAVESVLGQSYPNVEVVIVDDNGLGTPAQRETQTKARRFVSPRVHYHPNRQNLGVSASRNRGVEMSEGDYVTFLDDDDLYLADKVAKQLDLMRRERLTLSLCSFTRFSDADGSPLPPGIQDPMDSPEAFMTRHSSPHAPTIMIRRDLFETVGGFPEDLAYREDRLLVVRALAQGGVLGTLQEPLFRYRCHAGERLSKKGMACAVKRYIYQRVLEEERPLMASLRVSQRRRLMARRSYRFFNDLYKSRCRIDSVLFLGVVRDSLLTWRPAYFFKALWKYPVSLVRTRSEFGRGQ